MLTFIFCLLYIFWSVLGYFILKNTLLDNLGYYTKKDQAIVIAISCTGPIGLAIALLVRLISVVNMFIEQMDEVIETR